MQEYSFGNVYRHPHNNCDDFFQYLETCLANQAKENKEVYICGTLISIS